MTDAPDPLDTLASHAQLPDGCIPTSAVLIVGLIDEEGEGAYQLLTAGDAPVSQHLGLMAPASHALITSQDDDDEP